MRSGWPDGQVNEVFRARWRGVQVRRSLIACPGGWHSDCLSVLCRACHTPGREIRERFRPSIPCRVFGSNGVSGPLSNACDGGSRRSPSTRGDHTWKAERVEPGGGSGMGGGRPRSRQEWWSTRNPSVHSSWRAVHRASRVCVSTARQRRRIFRRRCHMHTNAREYTGYTIINYQIFSACLVPRLWVYPVWAKVGFLGGVPVL